MFHATYSNISAISWWPVSVVEEAEYLEITTDHEEAIGKIDPLRLCVECTLFVIYKNQARTQVVLVIDLYELLGITTT